MTGFPYFIDDDNNSGTHSPSPLVDDFDNDGDIEYVFASIAGTIHFFDMPDFYNNNFGFWNSYKHDMQNTGAILPIPIFTDLKEEDYKVISDFKLMQNYPNPFNPSTKIKFTIPQFPLHGGDGRGGLVTLKIYDVLGKEIAILVNAEKQPGVYEIEFDGSNLSSGIYLYRLTTGEFSDTKKLILIK